MRTKSHNLAARTRSGLWVALAVAGCTRASPPLANQPARPTGTPAEQARAYESGHGAARDYRAAAEIYRVACDQGRGDVAMCGQLIRARLRSRGIDWDWAAISHLATTICVERRDAFGCVTADLMSKREASIPESTMRVIQEVVGNMHPCDADHLSECHAMLLGSALDFSDGSAAQARRRDQRRQLCSVGITESCVEIVTHASGDRDRADVADAERRLQAACDAGDADACAEAPDRPAVSLNDLCAAADYVACAVLGFRGNQAAAAVATKHGVSDDYARVIRPSRAERVENGRAAAAQMVKLKGRMCACKDLPCVEQVEADMATASAAQAGFAAELPQEFADAVKELIGCKQRVLDAVPPPAPATGAPGGTGATSGSGGPAAAERSAGGNGATLALSAACGGQKDKKNEPAGSAATL